MYKKIMVPVDGSTLAECVFPHIDALAKGCGVSEIFFVRVAEPAFIPGGTCSDGGGEITEPEMEKLREQEAKRARTEAKEYLDGIISLRLLLQDEIRKGHLGRPKDERYQLAQDRPCTVKILLARTVLGFLSPSTSLYSASSS
jgi:nucleotide-binding universal stress UspA family protein